MVGSGQWCWGEWVTVRLVMVYNIPMQGIFPVACGPKVFEVAKHDMGRPAAGPIPSLVG